MIIHFRYLKTLHFRALFLKVQNIYNDFIFTLLSKMMVVLTVMCWTNGSCLLNQ